MDETALLDMDATAIAEKIKSKEVSCEEVVRVYVGHIKKTNPFINAMVETRFDEALEESKHLDEQIKKNQWKGPLHGVPIIVKEAFHVANMKTTGGLVHRQDLISRIDADVVTRLKNAGAIILGKTNTPALSFSQETENKLYGRTNNPWDLSKTAGGSSGGEGAILAVGGSAAGIGSDIGGSIRIPTHFNGVVSFKPGRKTVPSEGHFPPIHDPLLERMFAVGPMGKSVRDMRFMYQLIANRPIEPNHLLNFKVEILPGSIDYPLSLTTIQVLDEIEGFLGKSLTTKRTIPPFFDDSAKLWQEIIASSDSKVLERGAYNNDRTGIMKGLIKERIAEKTSVKPSLTKGIFASKIFKPSAKRVREIQQILDQGDERLKTYLKNRLLIFPVYHSAAPKHGKVYREIFSLRKRFLLYMPYVAYANVWGLPALTIPVAIDEHGLPLSIQIMSAKGNEDAIFRLGRVLERKFRGYKRCTTFD